MRKIMIINPKGGSGKSTLACNLAGYYANWGVKVALADMDCQKSSLAWLRNRPVSTPRIFGVSARNLNIPTNHETKYLIIDTPAAFPRESLNSLIHQADTLVIPVLASPIDIQAAGYFLYQLLMKNKITSYDRNICLVANRVRKNTHAFRDLSAFLDNLKIPFVTSLRESRNYLLASERGLSIFDMQNQKVQPDVEQWSPLTHWIESCQLDGSGHHSRSN